MYVYSIGSVSLENPDKHTGSERSRPECRPVVIRAGGASTGFRNRHLCQNESGSLTYVGGAPLHDDINQSQEKEDPHLLSIYCMPFTVLMAFHS